ncbi:MAG: hypothetical protein J07HX64_02686 [halophilic archaeon J07HX64]|jgi:hypothetical protein|nr:MAG: hypothetical protein J07HX64_02686 [halophilic archaeon J07HX64]
MSVRNRFPFGICAASSGLRVINSSSGVNMNGPKKFHRNESNKSVPPERTDRAMNRSAESLRPVVSTGCISDSPPEPGVFPVLDSTLPDILADCIDRY